MLFQTGMLWVVFAIEVDLVEWGKSRAMTNEREKGASQIIPLHLSFWGFL